MIDCLYTNGDSWTYGSELPTKADAWPNIIAGQLGKKLYNAAVPGSTNDKIVRTTVVDCLRFKKLNQTPLVLIAWTHLHRFELPIAVSNGENYYNFVNPNDQGNPAVAQELWSNWSCDRTDANRWSQQQLLLGAFLKDQGIPYHFFITFNKIGQLHRQWPTYTDQYYQDSFDIISQAYPKAQYNHPLEQGHQSIADYVLAKIDDVKGQ
jgi:hypothetical protein